LAAKSPTEAASSSAGSSRSRILNLAYAPKKMKQFHILDRIFTKPQGTLSANGSLQFRISGSPGHWLGDFPDHAFIVDSSPIVGDLAGFKIAGLPADGARRPERGKGAFHGNPASLRQVSKREL
jgi:hypothetical protein